jgi:hypothetical protein
MIVVAAPVFAQPPDSVGSDGDNNTAMGSKALLNQTAGESAAHDNTAAGASTLTFTTTGAANTALGSNALTYNTMGNENTAAGYGALYRNTDGNGNSAFGVDALNFNTSGSENTAMGLLALEANSTGGENTANGFFALANNTTGGGNTAGGAGALANNTTGSGNTSIGLDALDTNTAGANNTAIGASTLYNNATGNFNTAVGAGSLNGVSQGSSNIALGYNAGERTTGSNNIDIGNLGVAADNGVIRIGTGGTQKSVFVAGIATKKLTGSAVYITSTGELGVLASSERYKTSIASMGMQSAKLRRLRPVTFHLKSEPDGAMQFGLIAEEVDKIYPELVIRDDAGEIQGVRYDELAPMLLNEVQRLGSQIRRDQELSAAASGERTAMRRELTELKRQNQLMQAANQSMQTMLSKLLAKDERVAMR